MRALTAAMVCLLAVSAGVRAQDARDAERRLQSVRSELRDVANQRRKLEDQRGDASRRLREADEHVGGSQRSLQQTRMQIQQGLAELTRLQAARARHAGDLVTRKAELARLLRAAQQTGEAPALQALLAQDRVEDAERAVTLAGYLQRAQVEKIRHLSAEIAQIQSLESQVSQQQLALDASRRQQTSQLAQLQQARQQRAGLLAGIEQQYQDRSAREKALGQDARALQSLLTQLRVAAARAEREAARAKAEAERQARLQGKPAPARTRPPPALASLQHVGGMSWPVAGNLLASFGGRLPDGRRSDGVLIAANAGTQVKAVADGTVVFADWMTGYGNILIIDHGQGYMSLYAHNDGLLRAAGDSIQRGQPVATVGSSGGQDRPALYFELRRNGAPVNPADWLKRQ
ncbi:MAG: peptidoglycan DD-metalloendopeptidase family protein [Xanthomonadaceae bacterium]|nr:peptidoglycan DD-metalloendopeptidase family protein [Xanthomonadaceae bacterium]